MNLPSHGDLSWVPCWKRWGGNWPEKESFGSPLKIPHEMRVPNAIIPALAEGHSVLLCACVHWCVCGWHYNFNFIFLRYHFLSTTFCKHLHYDPWLCTGPGPLHWLGNILLLLLHSECEFNIRKSDIFVCAFIFRSHFKTYVKRKKKLEPLYIAIFKTLNNQIKELWQSCNYKFWSSYI